MKANEGSGTNATDLLHSDLASLFLADFPSCSPLLFAGALFSKVKKEVGGKYEYLPIFFH